MMLPGTGCVNAVEPPRVGALPPAFRKEYCRQARAWLLLLHTGDALEWLAPAVLAAPWWRVL